FLSIDIRNGAVPNLNPMQTEPPERVDYAPYIKGGWISINKQEWRLESPADGKWGHASRELVAKEISTELEPGLNTIDFRAENRIGLSATASKNLFLIGLKFNSVYAIPAEGSMRVAWTTAVELFGAAFDVMRSDLTTGSAETRIATVSEPDGIGNRRAYSHVDTAVQAAHKYRYRLDGKFSITFRGEKLDYTFSSHDVSATASVPVGNGIVSNLLPNPTRDRVMFTVNVPKSAGSASGSRAAAEEGGAASASALGEVRTRVDICVYNVLGQRIKSVYSNSVFSGIMTLAWDGTDSYNRTVPAGVYFMRVIAGNETAVRKVVILR
ncbi:MAG: T9SS type A sorting domain-containing protein, partial [Candidatus Krumholzibacteriia bacterium]